MGKRWRQGSIEGGGAITVAAFDPSGSGVTICGGDVSGLHRSSPSGRRWYDRNAGRSGVYSIKVACIKWHPSTVGKVYSCCGNGSGTGSGLYVSNDYGVSWSLLSSTPKFAANRVPSIPALPSPWPRSVGNLLEIVGSVMYAGTFSDGLMRSTDGGTTWTTIALGGGTNYIRSIAIDPAVPNRVFVATYLSTAGGVYCVDSADTTPVVTQLTNSLPATEEIVIVNSTVYCIAQDGVYSKAANASDTTWTTLLSVAGKWMALAGYQEGPNVVLYASPYAGTLGTNSVYSNLYKSTDGGATWTDILQTATISKVPYESTATWWFANNIPLALLGAKRYYASSIVVNPTNHSEVLVVGKAGVWMTTDGGATWAPSVHDLSATINAQIMINGNDALVSDADWNFIHSNNLFKGGDTLLCSQVPADGIAMCSDGSNWYVGAGNYNTTNSGGCVYTYQGFSSVQRDIKWDIAGGSVSAMDTFNRTLTNTWGSPDLGPAWILHSGAANKVSTTPGAGKLDAVGNASEHAMSLATSISDIYFETTASFDRLPSTGTVEARVLFRVTESPYSHYAAVIRVDTTGSLLAYIRKYDTVNGVTTIGLGSADNILITNYTPGTQVNLAGSIVGADITYTARLQNGGAEPVTVTYSDNGVLHGAVLTGQGVGLTAISQSAAGGAVVSFGTSLWQSLGDTGIDGAWPLGLATGLNATGDRMLVGAAQTKGVWMRNVTTNSAWTQVSTGFSIVSPSSRRLPMAWSTVNNDTIWAFDLTDGVYRSTDYGASWSKVWSVTGDNGPIGYGGWMVADPTNGGVLWMVVDDGAYKITNARTGTWTATKITAAPNASCVGVAPNGDVYITCVPTSTGQFAALYRSTDHGATWTDIADDNYRNSAILARSVAARNDGTVLVATNGCGVLVYDEPVMKAQMS